MNIRKALSRNLTRREVLALAESGWWKKTVLIKAAQLQLRQRKLCMPFDLFRWGLEIVLGRKVLDYEFNSPELLITEMKGRCA